MFEDQSVRNARSFFEAADKYVKNTAENCRLNEKSDYGKSWRTGYNYALDDFMKYIKLHIESDTIRLKQLELIKQQLHLEEEA